MPDFTGRAARLTDAGVAAAAQSIGTTPRLLRTVMAVETAGRGFDGQGRLRMLFEPGTFFHRVPEAKRDAACRAGCALGSMAGHRYPNDSYPLLEAAMRIDATAALESASWGLAQIMGFNHGLAGHVSAEAMIADFVDSEDAHVMALARFLKASRLVDALNAHRWADVARGYNGLGYERNAYDTKLAAAYAAIKDATAAAVATAVPPRVPLAVDTDKPVLAGIERAINAAGAAQSRPPVAIVGAVGPAPVGGKRLAIADEVDAYPARSQGDPLRLAAERAAAFRPTPVAVSASVPTAGPAHIDAARKAPLTGWRALWASVRAHFGQPT